MLDKYTYDRNETIKLYCKELALFGKKKVVDFKGFFLNWADAVKHSSGYDNDAIFDKVKQSAKEVINGSDCFERDGCLFNKPEYYFTLLFFIEKAMCENGRVSVLDFGGGMASSYYQNKNFLSDMGEMLSWTVIEQPHFVEFGQKNMENEQVKFKEHIEEVEGFNFVIFGSCLQYIENYSLYLQKVFFNKPQYILVDRTPMSKGTWITIEKVHEPIYEASYPLYVFDREEFERMFREAGYMLLTDWHPDTGNVFRYKNKRVVFESMLWRLKE